MPRLVLLPAVIALIVAWPALAQTPPTPAAAAEAEAAKPLDAAGVKALIAEIDRRQRNSGDHKSLVYIEAKERDKDAVIYEAVMYRRDKDDRFMMLFLQPKAERGKGYLKIDKNLWMFDPSVGRWERRTERERLGGSDSRRSDLDESNIATEFDATYVQAAKLGKYDVHVIDLVAKKGVDVAYPRVRIWVDVKTTNVLKRTDSALSGRLMRTTYMPRWSQAFSPSRKESVWVPAEIRIFDEVEKGNKTLVLIKKTDLNPLPANIFTKAWLESQSR